MRKRTLIVTGVIAALIGLVIFSLLTRNSTNSTKNSIPISNYAAYVKNLDPSEQTVIESSLYNTAALNTSDKSKLKTIKDAVIREKSYTQGYKDNIYTTAFIVDMKSIGQSYRIEDYFSRLSVEQSGLTDYTTQVHCLDTQDLLYGDFNCKDVFSQQAGVSQSDPILQYLPISTLTYSLEVDTSSDSLHIIATIHLSEIDYKLGETQAVAQYKSDIQTWFTSHGLDINNYSITYKIN